MKGLTGPQNEVILKAKRAAMLHNACKMAHPSDINRFVEKMGDALDELTDAVMDLEIYENNSD